MALDFDYDSSQEGGIALRDSLTEGETNYCCEEAGHTFKVRSKTYLADKVKQPSAETAFDFITFFVIKHKAKVWNAAENLRPVKDFLSKYPDDFFFVFLRQVPAKKGYIYNTVVITRRKRNTLNEDPFQSLFDDYLESDDGFKNQRLKYIARLDKAPWAVLSAVKALGGEKPVLMGRGYLRQSHYQGANYCEVNVDIGSSLIARQISGTVTQFASSFRVSESFVLEGRKIEELPEKVLACWTLDKINLSKGCLQMRQEDADFFAANPEPSTS